MHFVLPHSAAYGPYCKKNVEAVASKKFGLEVNLENAKCIFMFREYTSIRGQNYNVKIGNKFTENVANFRCVGTTVANQNCMLVGCKSRLHS
jgi:hypothetical protein